MVLTSRQLGPKKHGPTAAFVDAVFPLRSPTWIAGFEKQYSKRKSFFHFIFKCGEGGAPLPPPSSRRLLALRPPT